MDDEMSRRERYSSEWRALRFILSKEIKLWKRYPSRILFMLLMPFLSILSLYFQGMGLLGDTTSAAFEDFAGTQDYLVFIILGSALFIFVSTVILGIGNSIRREQMMGTLESIWVAPISKLTVFMGIALFDGLFSTYVAFMQLFLSSILLPVNLLVPRALVALLLTFLLMFALYGMGFIFTGLVLIYKEIEDFTNLITSTIRMITPVSYPLSVLPAPVAFLALFIPLTYALEGVRGYMGVGAYHPLHYYVAILIACDILFVGIGSRLFYYADGRARRRGDIGTH